MRTRSWPGASGSEPLAGVAVGGSYTDVLAVRPSCADVGLADRGACLRRRPRRGGRPAFSPGRVARADARGSARRRVSSASSRMLRWFGTDARAIPHAAGYVYAMCFGMPAMLVFLAHRYTSEGIGWTQPVMYTAVVGLSTNIAGNSLFTLGGLGIPSQGARGCGIATALACWAMLATMYFYQRRHVIYRKFGLFERFDRPDRASLGRDSGARPANLGFVVWKARSSRSRLLLMSTLGTEIVAAHQVALSYAWLMFMIPVSLHGVPRSTSATRSARRRHRRGPERRLERHCDVRRHHGAVVARHAGRAGRHRGGSYTTNPDVRELAVSLFCSSRPSRFRTDSRSGRRARSAASRTRTCRWR